MIPSGRGLLYATGMWIRLVMVLAGGIAALLLSRDAVNFEVVAGMIAVAMIALVVVVLAWTRRR